MNSQLSLTRFGALALAGALALSTHLSGQTTTSLDNFVEFGGGAAWVGGDTTSFHARQQIERNGFAGITGLYYSQEKDGASFSVEGNAVTGNGDYYLKLKYAPSEKLSFNLLYRKFTIWSDGTGEYLPYATNFANGMPLVSPGKNMHSMSRTEFSIGGTFKPSETFSVSLSYTRLERDGFKASTIEGGTYLTGIPRVLFTTVGAMPSNSVMRSIVPAFYGLSEKRDIFVAKADVKLGATDLGAGLRWESTKINDRRYWNMNPWEYHPGSPSRFLTQTDGTQTDLFSVHFSDVNRINERLMLTAAIGYTTFENTLAGSRLAGTGYNVLWNPSFVGPRGTTVLGGNSRADTIFFNLTGITEEKQRTGNLGLMYTPTPDWQIVPSLRVARISQDSASAWTQTGTAGFSGGIPVPASVSSRIGSSEQRLDENTFAIETRYTGLPGWVVNARLESAREEGDFTKATPVALPNAASPYDLLHKRDTDRFAMSANWYYSSQLTFAALYDYNWRKNAYEGDETYIRKQAFETHHYGIRATLRTQPGVTYVVRLDRYNTDIRNGARHLPMIDSGELKSSVFSQTLTWLAADWLFVQGALTRVSDTLDTPASRMVDPAVAPSSYGATSGLGTLVDVMPISKNSYWNGTITVGFIADKDTDITVSYDRNSASNWYDNSATVVPYGADYKEQTYRVTASRRLSENLLISGEYAFVKLNDRASGGANNYEGQILTGKIQLRF